MCDFSRQMNVSLHFPGHLSAASWEGRQKLGQINSAQSRSGLKACVFLRQVEGEATHSTSAIDFGFDIREENVPRLQTQFGIQVSCLDSAKAKKTRPQAALAVHRGRRRIDNSRQIHLLQFAEYLVSFEENG